MNTNECTYCCIDLKSFYASVECVDRGLDPLTAHLIVADPERGGGTICLAVSPALKKLGVSARPRVYEIPTHLEYIMAPPRMALYMEKSAEIVGIYYEYVSPDDVHVYSIDECFIDLTPYNKLYGSPLNLAKLLQNAVLEKTGITATVGVGPNLFQAKVALDILAKHSPDGMAVLTDESFRKHIWPHEPITDIWGIGKGIARRLAKYGIHTLEDITHADIGALYREFGINAEYLIDHAWGLEPCTIEDIHNYVPKGSSINNGQVLMRDYEYSEARRVAREEVEESVGELVARNAATSGVALYVGYSKEVGPYYAGGSKKLSEPTDSLDDLCSAIDKLFTDRVVPGLPIRRVNVSFTGLVPIEGVQSSLLAKNNAQLAEKKRVGVSIMNKVTAKYGKGTLMHGTSYMPSATGRERAALIGGHRAY